MIRHIASICLLAASAAAQTLTVSGDLPKPLKLTAAEFANMPRETVTIPEQDGAKTQYEGVALREIMKLAGAPLGKVLRGKALASYIVARAHDGYQVVFTLGEIDTDFGGASIVVADKRDGKPLPAPQGPFRLVVANDKAGARGVRMLDSLEFVKLKAAAP